MKAADCTLCEEYRVRGGIFWDSRDQECIHTCGSCHYYGDEVECAGIYYCPNPLCRGCGGSWIADGLKQTSIPGTNQFTVDGNQLREKQIAVVARMTNVKLLAFMRSKYPEFVAEARGQIYERVVTDHDPGDEHVERP